MQARSKSHPPRVITDAAGTSRVAVRVGSAPPLVLRAQTSDYLVFRHPFDLYAPLRGHHGIDGDIKDRRAIALTEVIPEQIEDSEHAVSQIFI